MFSKIFSQNFNFPKILFRKFILILFKIIVDQIIINCCWDKIDVRGPLYTCLVLSKIEFLYFSRPCSLFAIFLMNRKPGDICWHGFLHDFICEVYFVLFQFFIKVLALPSNQLKSFVDSRVYSSRVKGIGGSRTTFSISVFFI